MKETFKILILDDEKEHRDTLRMILESCGFVVGEANSGVQALDLLENEYYPLVLCDYIMPGLSGHEVLARIKKLYDKSIEVIIVTGYGGVETAVEAMKLGAFGYFIKGNNPEELIIEIYKAKKMVSLQSKQNLISSINVKRIYLNQTKNKKMQEIFGVIENVANTNANVLLLGESGVGKEVIAQRIHEKSNRLNMPFIPINCQYFSLNLLESELFGHEKGAFTGANDRRIGRFEEANGGTIFLDEIGEISNDIQVKFLRVLDSRKIERIGSNKQIGVNIRLISATNKNILEEVKKHNFRDDLYYRINTITIEIPPLRERKEDLEDMINFFINLFKTEFNKDVKGIEDNTFNYLLNYNYPGNIRELKNIIERLFVLSQDGILKLDNTYQDRTLDQTKNANLGVFKYNVAKENFEREYFLQALGHFDFNVTQTANAIGLSSRQLFNKINEYKLRENK